MSPDSYSKAEPLNVPRQVIERMARAFAEAVDFQPGDSIAGIVDLLSGRIDYCAAEEDVYDGSLIVHGPGDFEIKLSPWTSEDRDRFTVAHEVGHYVLHSQCGEKRITATRHGNTRVEWEANWFAAELLMPTAVFSKQFEALDGDISKLAKLFKVSRAAAGVRATSLGR